MSLLRAMKIIGELLMLMDVLLYDLCRLVYIAPSAIYFEF